MNKKKDSIEEKVTKKKTVKKEPVKEKKTAKKEVEKTDKKVTKKKTIEEVKDKKKVVVKKETKKKKDEVKKEVAKEEKTVRKTEKQVKEKETALLEKKDQKTLKTLSRIVCVLAKIARVCTMIVVPFMAIIAISLPILLSKVEVNGNIIKYKDIRIVMNNDKITATVGDKVYEIADNVENMDQILEFLNTNTVLKVMISIEVSVIFAIIIFIIDIYLLGYVIKLFDNFYRNKTPFTEENSDNIHRIGKLMIYSLVAKIIGELVLAFMGTEISLAKLNSYSIIGVIVIYIAYFIFTYASKLQEKNNTCIYD